MVINLYGMECPLTACTALTSALSLDSSVHGWFLGCAVLAILTWEAEEGRWPVTSQSLGAVTKFNLFWVGHKTRPVSLFLKFILIICVVDNCMQGQRQFETEPVKYFKKILLFIFVVMKVSQHCRLSSP